MTSADQDTVSRMQATRRVEWGHWGLTFTVGPRVVATLPFPCGPGGPADGFVGSPEQERYRAACRGWVARGELPEGALRVLAGDEPLVADSRSVHRGEP